MKRILLTSLFVTLGLIVHAQVTVNGVDINALTDVNYIKVRYSSKHVLVDYGQDGKEYNKSRISAAGDKEYLEFKGDTDMLNYLYKNGWEYVTMTVYPGIASTEYILRRRK